MVSTTISTTALRFMEGGGRMGELIRSFEWAQTTLGTPNEWPENLRSALSICLNSGFPIAIYWGSDFSVLYNDAWSTIPGDKHPWALGRPGKDVWPEIWDQLDAQFKDVLHRGASIRSPDTLLPMVRYGYVEECYFDYTLSPIYDTSGNIGGVLNAVVETSYKVINERRNFAVHRLLRHTAAPTSKDEACKTVIAHIEQMKEDIPFCLLYELMPGNKAQVCMTTTSGTALAAIEWPFEELLNGSESVLIHDLRYYTDKKVIGSWPEPCTEAMVIPLKYPEDVLSGFLIAGVSPRKRLDTEYKNFLQSVGLNINAAIARGIIHEQQMQAKRSLEESERNLRNIILQAPVAMCILNGPEHMVEIANERMFDLWGKAAVELQGKPIFEALPEAQGQGFEELLNDVYHTGKTFSASAVPVSLPRNTGLETVYINLVYQAIRNASGEISGVFAVAVDVTEHVLSQKKLEEAEERARIAIAAAEQGSFEINLLTDELIPSPRFSQIFGLSVNDNRAAFLKTIHPDDLAVGEEAYERSYKTGRLEYESRVLKNKEGEHWVRIKGSVFFDDQGRPAKVVGIAQDITEQKLFAAELNRLVAERTRELQLANEQLEQSNSELEQFAYVASHDLQEPLRKIMVFSEIAIEEPSSDRQHKSLQKVTSSAKRMSGLIKELLNYSRLSNGQARHEQTDLNIILQNILSDFEVTISQKKAQIICEQLPTIPAVPLQMNQLFFNLVGNALKFNRKNTAPIVSVKARNVPPDEIKKHPQLNDTQDYCEITFTDNGIGFEQEYADKIFGIFQRLNEQSIYGGYGIGLALCRKIVESHKGVIYARGQPMKGAAFTIILPYNKP